MIHLVLSIYYKLNVPIDHEPIRDKGLISMHFHKGRRGTLSDSPQFLSPTQIPLSVPSPIMLSHKKSRFCRRNFEYILFECDLTSELFRGEVSILLRPWSAKQSDFWVICSTRKTCGVLLKRLGMSFRNESSHFLLLAKRSVSLHLTFWSLLGASLRLILLVNSRPTDRAHQRL